MLEEELNKIYRKIAETINDTIPVTWGTFYFNAEIDKREGGIFFFFNTPNNLDEYVFSHDLPDIFHLNEKEYDENYNKLFRLSVNLQEKFLEYDQEPWYSFDMNVTSEGKLKVHFGYTQWNKSDFGPSDRIDYFEYKYLKKVSNNRAEKIKFEKMREYEELNKS